MNNFAQRTISGAVFAAVVIGLTLYHPLSLLALVLLIGCVGTWEFLKLENHTDTFKNIATIALHISVILIAYIRPEKLPIALATFASLALLYVFISLFRKSLDTYQYLAGSFFALAYIAVPLALFYSYAVQGDLYDAKKPLLVFFLVWSSDTFAYLTGRAFGRTPLHAVLSPKKTWEGFAGGTILTGILSGILAYYWHFLDISQAVLLGIAVSIFGTAGDLFQSSLKRNAGAKDSGKIIPGHGGILDRFDAFIFVCVVVYIFFLIF